MTLQEAIVEYRAKHDMTLQEFADKCKISIMTASYVERGLQKPNRLTTKKIMLVLKGED